MDFLNPDSVLDLGNIRDVLVRMEDTIIFNFIERSQFYSTPSIYRNNEYSIPGFEGSFVEYALLQRERNEAQLRRFLAPDEVSFFDPNTQLPKPILPPIEYPKILAGYNKQINVNDEIFKYYTTNVVPEICCGEGDQLENLGSCTMSDLACLQSLSRRIHFGKFVAECKFRTDRETYTGLIKKKDVDRLMELITNKQVEEKILNRLTEKAVSYGTDPLVKNSHSKVKSEVLVKVYRDWVIPLTKKVEIEYLLRRLEDE